MRRMDGWNEFFALIFQFKNGLFLLEFRLPIVVGFQGEKR